MSNDDSELQIVQFKHLLTFASLRETRVKEVYKLKNWLNAEHIRYHAMKEEYRKNTIYKDPEVEKMVQLQMDLAKQLYHTINQKYEDLVQFVQTGDSLLKSHGNDDPQFTFAYPSAADIEQMDTMIRPQVELS